MTSLHQPADEGPRRPKQRTDADPLITNEQRRRQLGASFAEAQSAAEARVYDRVRPRYPQQAVAEILSLCPDSPTVVDLGAGTGILSRQLLEADPYVRIEAVEPSAAMGEQLAHRVGHTGARVVSESHSTAAQTSRGSSSTSPSAEHLNVASRSENSSSRMRLHEAEAEATGLPHASADLVVAAQAWHWFDPVLVQQEALRLLRPGGGLALIWNYLDTSDPTVHRLARIMRAGDTYRPGWQPTLDGDSFTTLQTQEYRWQRSLSVEQIFHYATTLSSWLSADEGERAKRRGNLEDFLLRERGLSMDDVVNIPQITGLHTARRRHS